MFQVWKHLITLTFFPCRSPECITLAVHFPEERNNRHYCLKWHWLLFCSLQDIIYNCDNSHLLPRDQSHPEVASLSQDIIAKNCDNSRLLLHVQWFQQSPAFASSLSLVNQNELWVVFTMSVVYYGPSLCNPPWCNPPGTRENTLYVNSSRRTSLCVECARALWASFCFSVSSANQQSSAFRSHHLQQLRQQLSPSPWLMSASSRQPIEGHQLLQQRQESSPSLRPVSSNSPQHLPGTV